MGRFELVSNLLKLLNFFLIVIIKKFIRIDIMIVNNY